LLGNLHPLSDSEHCLRRLRASPLQQSRSFNSRLSFLLQRALPYFRLYPFHRVEIRILRCLHLLLPACCLLSCPLLGSSHTIHHCRICRPMHHLLHPLHHLLRRWHHLLRPYLRLQLLTDAKLLILTHRIVQEELHRQRTQSRLGLFADPMQCRFNTNGASRSELYWKDSAGVISSSDCISTGLCADPAQCGFNTSRASRPESYSKYSASL
jgi:hypothetical protein